MRAIPLFSFITIAACIGSAGSLLAQTQAVQHIDEAIIINGQAAQGVMIVGNGAIQTQSCPAPQQYATADGSSTGWACFDQTSQTWLLPALPAAQPGYPGSQVYVQAPPPVYSSYPYSYGYNPYPYAYYPYGYYPYSYYYGPTFGIGVGFGFGFDYRRPFVGRPYGPVGRPGGFGSVVGGRVGFARGGRR